MRKRTRQTSERIGGWRCSSPLEVPAENEQKQAAQHQAMNMTSLTFLAFSSNHLQPIESKWPVTGKQNMTTYQGRSEYRG